VPRQERYQQIAERFEQAARARIGRLERLADICEAIAVTARTLARAVRAVHGTTPSRHLRALRLAAVRQALCSAKEGAETVTDAAMRFGFRELGRFAADYRAAFGESPSETLRRASETGPNPDGDHRRAGCL
jgi:AraC-like DNA-binding protein